MESLCVCCGLDYVCIFCINSERAFERELEERQRERKEIFRLDVDSRELKTRDQRLFGGFFPSFFPLWWVLLLFFK